MRDDGHISATSILKFFRKQAKSKKTLCRLLKIIRLRLLELHDNDVEAKKI